MAKRKPGLSIVKILLQNDRVRLAVMTIKPGDRGRLVERPDRVRYVLKGGKIREHFADGKVKNYLLKPGTGSVAGEKHLIDGERRQDGGELYYRPGILGGRVG